MFRVVKALLLLACIKTGHVTSSTACSPANWSNDLDLCLHEINATLFDTDRFWFGSDYAGKCPGGPYSFLCSNHRPTVADSIMSRLFPNTSPMPQLDRYLEVTYNSIDKDYSGCGVTYRAADYSVNHINIDPLSPDTHEPWFLRHLPTMRWSYEDDEYFTLIFYDVGYPVVHGVYANIQGNDIANSQIIDVHHGPLATQNTPNPYVYFLYKHDQPLNVSQALIDVITSQVWGSGNEALETFSEGLNLGGPIAANVVLVIGDIYASQVMYDLGIIYTCPVYSTKAILEVPRPFIANDTDLAVWLDVEFSTEAMAFSSCCSQYSYPAENFYLNPLGNPIYKTAEVRSEAQIRYSLKQRRQIFGGGADNFDGEIYTLIIVDPDVPFPEIATQEKPLLHGMIVNIMDGIFASGETVASYRGPAPPDYKTHTYYFLLYRQAATLNATEMSTYAGDSCLGGLVGRCLFDINSLVSNHSLELIGANWLSATTDEYIRKNNVANYPANEMFVCKDIAGYDDPCPTATAANVAISYWTLLVANIVLLSSVLL